MAFIYETLGSFMDKKCAEYQGNEAMVFSAGNTRYTYGEFHKLYTTIAKGLIRLGVKKGEHLAILSLNSPLWIAFQIAAAKIGAVMVCVNTSYTKTELAYVLEHSEASMLIMTSGHKSNSFVGQMKELCPELAGAASSVLALERFPALRTIVMLDNAEVPGTLCLNELLLLGESTDDSVLAEASAELDPYSAANIYYTSGTTGNPKAVLTSHFSIVNNALVSGERMQYCESDRLLLCLPLFHVIGYVLSAISGMFFGAALIIIERFETKKVLSELADERCTVFNGVPTMYNFLLGSDNLFLHDLSSLSKGFIAGSCCSNELMADIRNKLGIASIANLYGQTEAIGITQIADSDSLAHRLGSVGKPLPGVETKITDPVTGVTIPGNGKGELCVKSIYIMQGYYKDAKSTEKTVDKDGWLHTGDLATCDNEGYISIIGRIKDIIIRGGENISPAEIEHALCLMDGVADVAVVGVPDDVMGEEICAFIVRRNNAAVSKEDICGFVAATMAKYKIPKYVSFISELPVTSSGKVRKFALREIAVREHLPIRKEQLDRELVANSN